MQGHYLLLANHVLGQIPMHFFIYKTLQMLGNNTVWAFVCFHTFLGGVQRGVAPKVQPQLVYIVAIFVGLHSYTPYKFGTGIGYIVVLANLVNHIKVYLFGIGGAVFFAVCAKAFLYHRAQYQASAVGQFVGIKSEVQIIAVAVKWHLGKVGLAYHVALCVKFVYQFAAVAHKWYAVNGAQYLTTIFAHRQILYIVLR